MSYRVRAVEPIGEQTSPAFVTTMEGCSFRDVTTPVYPEEPRGEQLRRARVDAGVSLRRAADALVLSAVEVSGLERGRYVFVDAGDWERATSLLRSLPREW